MVIIVINESNHKMDPGAGRDLDVSVRVAPQGTRCQAIWP